MEKIQIKDYYVISINFLPLELPIDMIWISNIKRFKNLDNMNKRKDTKIVVTSNIKMESENDYWVVNYSSYLNEGKSIVDNAGLMCINLLNKLNIKKLSLVGFDGFFNDIRENYYLESLCVNVEEQRLDSMNMEISTKLMHLSKQMEITFMTVSLYKTMNS